MQMINQDLPHETPAAPADYARIEQALGWLSAHWEDQPSLSDLGTQLGLSDYHLQRLFTRWAGISPKQFVALLTLQQAKARLRDGESVLDAAYASGMSGPGRLHDLFVTHEAVTPGEYKRLAAGLTIRYGWHDGLFGRTLVMVTDRGLCGLAFADTRGEDGCFADMAARWPLARLCRDDGETAAWMVRIFAPAVPADAATGSRPPLRLFLKGTAFQVRVWRALMDLPPGSLTTYGRIAACLGLDSRAARAIGGAVGANPVSWLIPCHRVIRESGALGGYRWGLPRKLAMMGWEASGRDARAV